MIVAELGELHRHIERVCAAHLPEDEAELIASKVVLAEQMGVATHGLHYFVHSLLPHVVEGRINRAPIRRMGNVVLSEGDGGVGFINLQRALEAASEIASEVGISIAVLRKPGKVGALRVFCQQLMDRGQLVLMMKNTARTMGVAETGEAVLGTNPLCIGLPDTRFIYDASTATVATNKVRLARKMGRTFDHPIGLDGDRRPTTEPAATVDGEGYLLPFSYGPYWFKSFFLGAAIEAIAAMAGGSTSRRVGEHTGSRLHSREGMVAIVVDRRSFPGYDDYRAEVEQLLAELRGAGLRIPGDYDGATGQARVLAEDWQALLEL